MRAVQLCSEHLCPKHLGLGQEIRTVEGCGSDEWQISGWVRPGQNVGHHIQAPWNVSGFQCYVIVMVPGHDVPQESTHLC